MSLSAQSVEEAATRVRDVVKRTPLERSLRLSARFGADVYLKREDLQTVRSYKIRGAYNFLSSLTEEQSVRGVVCASAGNHAQGVAYSCQRLGIRGTIFVPTTTPRQKKNRIAVFGGDYVDLVVAGANFDASAALAAEEARATGKILVHAFDDPVVASGQGTVAVESAAQLQYLGLEADLVVVPIGGGGLFAGMATWWSEQPNSPRLIGVEPAGAPSMTAALEAGRPVALEKIDSFVDGAAVRKVGEVTFPVVVALASQVTAVDEGKVCTEILELYEAEGIIAEPAGALASAALGDKVAVRPGSTVVCIVSGGNNDVSRYGEILERSLVHEGLKHYFLVEFPQEPGALRRFLDEVLGPNDDITLFEYVKKNNREVGPAVVGIEISRRSELSGLLDRMSESPLRIEPVAPGSPLFDFLL